MHSTEQRYALWLATGLVAVLSGCTSSVSLAPVPPAPPAPRVEPARSAPAPAPSTAPAPRVAQGPQLDPPKTPRNLEELHHQAALRVVAANPGHTYMGKPQDILLAIPVLKVEVNANGSIKHITVMREPGQAPETVQIAMDAVRRAAPFGDVSRLPKPWQFIETFLFNDDHRFKPRSLDDG